MEKEFNYSYNENVNGIRYQYLSGKTRTLAWRKEQLQGVIDMLTDHEADMVQALHADLRKPKMESIIMEIHYVKNDAIHIYNNISSWIKPRRVDKLLVDKLNDCYIQHDPYGVALVIGAWNYPIQLALAPLVGAIAGGNCAILKPSEIAPATAKLLEELIPKYLDKDCIKVINGGIPETTALLKEQFDIIFYTGNNMVAKIVMKAAAEHLTPVVLELGGKSPVYVDKNCDLSVVCRRLAWGKFVNAGQTCIAPDYIMCHPDIQTNLIKNLKETVDEFYGTNPKETADFARIISERHFNRVSGLIDENKVAFGGHIDKDSLYIAPTVLQDIDQSHPIMSQEIFGPILPVMPMPSITDAVNYINSHDTPLAMYIFSNDKHVVNHLIDSTNSGGVCVNDTIVHTAPPSLPFGGVGKSGMGRYHGEFSFKSFTTQRSVLQKALNLESVNGLRYPPFNDKKQKWVSWLISRKQKTSALFGLLPVVMVIGTLMAFAIKTMTFMG